MVDPTSDLGEDVDEADAPNCEHCGDPVVGTPDHRVHTTVEDDTVEHRHFCDDACLDEWRD
ncbi:DUF7576 family protein [Halostella salina]|uniref:DUF7576 family protein n=1 Tax=Halostella salina TaxID=1547897 RepID=UPI000EF7F20E|nr:hypothetical protein [Halostella salina]